MQHLLEEVENGVRLESAGLRVPMVPVQLDPGLDRGPWHHPTGLQVLLVPHHHHGDLRTSKSHDLRGNIELVVMHL